jgi:hypothetical protein
MNESYKNMLQADATLHAVARDLIRKNLSVDVAARELLPLTARYYEVLAQISWEGYQIESANEERIA